MMTYRHQIINLTLKLTNILFTILTIKIFKPLNMMSWKWELCVYLASNCDFRSHDLWRGCGCRSLIAGRIQPRVQVPAVIRFGTVNWLVLQLFCSLCNVGFWVLSFGFVDLWFWLDGSSFGFRCWSFIWLELGLSLFSWLLQTNGLFIGFSSECFWWIAQFTVLTWAVNRCACFSSWALMSTKLWWYWTGGRYLCILTQNMVYTIDHKAQRETKEYGDCLTEFIQNATENYRKTFKFQLKIK